eukprot:8454504-Alexandrium_andersonii.AAC.1
MSERWSPETQSVAQQGCVAIRLCRSMGCDWAQGNSRISPSPSLNPPKRNPTLHSLREHPEVPGGE